ncbi:MAG: hypothetical protein ACE5EI_02100 [Thermodesulfobacteriota bacterium]
MIFLRAVLTAAVLAIATSASPLLTASDSFAAPGKADPEISRRAEVMGEVMGMMKKTIEINTRLVHSVNAADKASLTRMIARLDDIEAGLSGEGQSGALRDVAAMLRHSMKMTREVVHAYPEGDKARLTTMKEKLIRTITDRKALKAGGDAERALEASLRDMAEMMGEIADYMNGMGHTKVTRAQKRRLEKMAARMDAIMADHAGRSAR